MIKLCSVEVGSGKGWLRANINCSELGRKDADLPLVNCKVSVLFLHLCKLVNFQGNSTRSVLII